LGALAFIFLMLGIEGMVGAAGIPFGLGLFLALIGALCFFAAFFWETAKKALSVEAQAAIGRFAQSRITWFGMMFLVLQTLILSPFIEQRRWPFSYPADPAIYAEKTRLENAIAKANGAAVREKELADKWRFATILRQLGKECRYQSQYTYKAQGVIDFWQALFRASGWIGDAGPPSGVMQPGITIRVLGDHSQCAEILQRALGDIYPNPSSKIVTNQQTSFLSACSGQANQECVQIEIDY
jgi:hypothetical protein